jgi:hypothetical protein
MLQATTTIILSKQLSVAFLAVRLSSVLCKRPARECLHAERAHEVLGVPLFVQCIDHAPCDGFTAPSA